VYFWLFKTLSEAREITERWLKEYNNDRSHESLNNLTAEEYRLMTENPKKCVRVKRVCLYFVVRVWRQNKQYWDNYFDLLENIKNSLDENQRAMPHMHIHLPQHTQLTCP
jgi:hypothetical protein